MLSLPRRHEEKEHYLLCQLELRAIPKAMIIEYSCEKS